MEPEKFHLTNDVFSTRSTRWGRRGVIASVLIGVGTVAVIPFAWFQSSSGRDGEYLVISEWQIPAGGKGMTIAVSPQYGREELRALGRRLRERFRHLDNTAVMIFDDANAARQVHRGSRILGETEFQAALVHQRAMYLKSLPRGEDRLTIYKSYPKVDEVIQFDEDDVRTRRR